MAETRLMYMHTLYGKPATWDGKSVVLVVPRGEPARLYRRLRTIGDHVAKDAKFWAQPVGQRSHFGWCPVSVPAAASPEGR